LDRRCAASLALARGNRPVRGRSRRPGAVRRDPPYLRRGTSIAGWMGMALRAPLASILLLALAGCSAAPDGTELPGPTQEAVCVESYDWHDFPGGQQCVGGVDGFFQAHFGVGLPALCQYPTQNGCPSCGARGVWEANAPDPK